MTNQEDFDHAPTLELSDTPLYPEITPQEVTEQRNIVKEFKLHQTKEPIITSLLKLLNIRK